MGGKAGEQRPITVGQMIDDPVAGDERGGFEARVHAEFRQDVLDVRPRRLRTYDERFSDRAVAGSLCQQEQNLAFPGCKPRERQEGLIPFLMVLNEDREERAQHPPWDEHFSGSHTEDRLSQLGQRNVFGEIAAGPRLQRFDQRSLIMLRIAQDDDAACGNASDDRPDNAGAAPALQVRVNDRDLRTLPLRFGNGLDSVRRLTHDLDVPPVRQGHADSFAEQGLPVRQEDADRRHGFVFTPFSLNAQHIRQRLARSPSFGVARVRAM